MGVELEELVCAGEDNDVTAALVVVAGTETDDVRGGLLCGGPVLDVTVELKGFVSAEKAVAACLPNGTGPIARTFVPELAGA